MNSENFNLASTWADSWWKNRLKIKKWHVGQDGLYTYYPEKSTHPAQSGIIDVSIFPTNIYPEN